MTTKDRNQNKLFTVQEIDDFYGDLWVDMDKVQNSDRLRDRYKQNPNDPTLLADAMAYVEVVSRNLCNASWWYGLTFYRQMGED